MESQSDLMISSHRHECGTSSSEKLGILSLRVVPPRGESDHQASDQGHIVSRCRCQTIERVSTDQAEAHQLLSTKAARVHLEWAAPSHASDTLLNMFMQQKCGAACSGSGGVKRHSSSSHVLALRGPAPNTCSYNHKLFSDGAELGAVNV